MTHPVLIAAFSDELSKLAADPVSTGAGGILKKIPYRDLLAMGAGAGVLYGGHRLYQDVKAGEQLRAAQQRGYY